MITGAAADHVPDPMPYAVFLQNTLSLLDVVPRVVTLGWYALPRWGKWDDGVSDTVPPTTFPIRRLDRISDTVRRPRFRSHAL